MSTSALSSRAIIGRFFAQLEQSTGPEWINRLAREMESDQASEDYAWLGMSPAMREAVGGRQAKKPRDFSYTIRNKHYESTLEIPEEDIRRDKTTQIMTRIDEQVERAQAHWASLLSTLIINGESTACYDGQFFFDTDHSEGDSGTQSNDISVDISALPTTNHGSTTAPSVGEMNLAIRQAVQQMRGFLDDQGEPMNEMANNFVVMCPTSLADTADAAIAGAMIDSGESNPIRNANYRLDVVSNARLDASWTTKFAVFRADGAVTPLIRQSETPLRVSAVAEGSELEFNEFMHRYGIDAWRNVGYGYWQYACLVTMT